MAKTDERRKLEDAAREFMEQHTAPRSQRKAEGLLDLLSGGPRVGSTKRVR
jgi:hypothetical protein